VNNKQATKKRHIAKRVGCLEFWRKEEGHFTMKTVNKLVCWRSSCGNPPPSELGVEKACNWLMCGTLHRRVGDEQFPTGMVNKLDC
jgi:hypothetical protein